MNMAKNMRSNIFNILDNQITKKHNAKKNITFLNLYSYFFLRKQKFIDLLELFYLYLDGIFLVKLISLLGIKCTRVSFDMTSLAPKVFEEASQKNLSIFIIGTKPGVIDKAVKNIKKMYPTLSIISYRHGYFKNDKEREEVLNQIKQLNPDIVICGMGTTLQEMFLVDLKKKGWKGTGYTCGGFLHQTAKKAKYYPDWADKYHLRWLYRLIDEPHLWKRYFIVYPIATVFLFYDFIKYKLSTVFKGGDSEVPP